MRELALEQIVIQGFCSFSQRTVVKFPLTPGMRFLTGSNQLEPRLEANGAGKSSLWEAVVWCNFNLSSKRKKASDLVSWGCKQIDITCTWIDPADGARCEVRRTSTPNRLYIDGEPAEQSEVESILGLNYDQFLQSVVFSQGARTFYDMDNAGRGELLDKTLNIELWVAAAEHAGAQARAVQVKIDAVQKTLARINGTLEGLEPESTFLDLIAAYDQEMEKKLDDALDQVEGLEARKKELETEETALRTTLDAKAHALRLHMGTIEQAKKDTQALIVAASSKIGFIDGAIGSALNALRAFKEDGVCPTCKQPVKGNHDFKRVESLKEDLAQHNKERAALLAEIEELNREQAASSLAWTDLANKVREMQKPLDELTWKLKEVCRNFDKAYREAEALGNPPPNPHKAALEANRARRQQLGTEKTAAENSLQKLVVELESLEFWQKGFKRLRLWLMRRVLNVLELEVAGAAASLGLPGWTIKFSTEAETKSGTLKPGIFIQVMSKHAPGVWANQSGGEEQRVRLAVSIGFAAVIQRMAGVWHKLEVWDEPSNWLSNRGIEDLLECLSYRAETTGRCIWVVDHRSLGSGSFTEAWSVIKTAQGSRVTVLAPEG